MGIPGSNGRLLGKYGVCASVKSRRVRNGALWFTLYPGIRRWRSRENYAISQDGITETRSLLGRRRTGITYPPERLSSQVLSIEADGAKHALMELFTHRDEVSGSTRGQYYS